MWESEEQMQFHAFSEGVCYIISQAPTHDLGLCKFSDLFGRGRLLSTCLKYTYLSHILSDAAAVINPCISIANPQWSVCHLCYIITLPSQSSHLGAQLLRVRPCGKKAPGSLALAFKCLSQNYLTCQILARISHMMPFHHKEIRKYNLSLCWKYLMNYIKHNHAYNWLHIYINYLELGLQLLILVMEVSMNSKITCNSCNASCPISFLLIYLSTGISLGQTY